MFIRFPCKQEMLNFLTKDIFAFSNLPLYEVHNIYLFTYFHYTHTQPDSLKNAQSFEKLKQIFLYN